MDRRADGIMWKEVEDAEDPEVMRAMY